MRFGVLNKRFGRDPIYFPPFVVIYKKPDRKHSVHRFTVDHPVCLAAVNDTNQFSFPGINKTFRKERPGRGVATYPRNPVLIGMKNRRAKLPRRTHISGNSNAHSRVPYLVLNRTRFYKVVT